MNAFLIIASLLVGPVHAAPVWLESLSQAQAQAKASGKPLLIEFHAPWCYSCYYMAGNVLSKPAFSAAAQGLVLLKADVDQEDGRALKAQYGVTALPSFVLVGPAGEVLGRIAGEQTEADFLARLKALLKGAGGGPDDRAVAELQQRLVSGETAQAAAAVARLGPERLKSLRGRKDWRVLEARLGLERGGQKAEGDLKTLLELDDSCELPYTLMDADKLLAGLPEARRRELLTAERKALEDLSTRGLFIKGERRCADFRSGVAVLAEVYERLGETGRRQDLIRRALAFLDGMGLKVGAARNHDDDRRFFLELARDDAGLKSFYAQLVATYPSDYVYSYRYARYLMEAGDPGGALTWAEKADKLCYGANRLAVTKVRARALLALGRKAEAAALLQRDIKAGKAFPDEAGKLAELLATLGKP